MCFELEQQRHKSNPLTDVHTSPLTLITADPERAHLPDSLLVCQNLLKQ